MHPLRQCLWIGIICGLVTFTSPTIGISAEVQDRGIRDFPKLSAERDWPWWRGPSRNGIAAEQTVPTKFGDSENVVWKTPVPGRGHSSPIIVGDRIFLETADEQQKSQSVVAFDRRTG